MKRILLVFFLSLSFSIFAQAQNISINKQEAQEAFTYLKAFRANPAKLMKALNVKFDASKVSKIKLTWNEKLAKVAEQRAYDMAARGYFDHVTPDGVGPNYFINEGGYALRADWLNKIDANNFESIGANHPTAVDGVKAFIIGKGSPGFMHRLHVLGMNDWYGSLVDIGIGFVNVDGGSPYKTYLCVLIAKHDW